MTTPYPMKDLVVIAADKQMQRTVETLLAHRYQALGIAQVIFDVLRHPQKDPGCRTASEALLTPSRNRYRKAIVVFDYHGSGEKNLTASELESALESRLCSQGWESESIAFVVIDPELEAWVFGATDRQLERVVNWSQPKSARDWLTDQGKLNEGDVKPKDPKAAINALLTQIRKPLDSALFIDLAQTVSLNRCRDRAFNKFRSTLQRWFPDH